MAASRSDTFMSCKTDVDSHEMLPMHLWGSAFGDVGELIAGLDMKRYGSAKRSKNSLLRPDIAGDDMAISYDSVWNHKGPDAPSAIDLTRRPKVMDEMGIERQLVFPSFALLGIMLMYIKDPHEFLGYDREKADPLPTGREACAAHNRWAARITKATNQRARPVAVIIPETPDQMAQQAEYLLGEGIRAFMLPAGTPPAGTSPADRSLDPFWSLLEKHNAPVTLHLGTEFAFLASRKWSANVPEFSAVQGSSVEFEAEPLQSATLHFCMENFLTAMILGGVLERHPNLRVGIIEACAHWVGPLAERLDMWAGQFSKRLSKTLSMPPSQYIARNIRATPFSFEPIDRYLKRYPALADVYCFSTDFPHVEGGQDAQRAFSEKLEAFEPSIREKFFRSNGMLLIPD